MATGETRTDGSYFREDTPSFDQTHTSDDGLYGIINLDPGRWRLELWGRRSEDGELERVAHRDATQVIANAINIANLQPDGITTGTQEERDAACMAE
jgi:hypothetical protein